MNRSIRQLVSLVLFLFALASLLQAQPHGTTAAKITVEVNKPGHTISPLLFGIFFEDINLSADGGIYPELVRSFAKDRNGKPVLRANELLSR